MKKNLSFTSLLIMLIIFIFSCSKPPISTIGVWSNKEKMGKGNYKTVMFVVLTQNIQIKTEMENALAEAAEAKGIKAYKSVLAFGPVANQQGLPLKDLFMKKINELGCQGIFAVRLLDAQSETKYVPASSSYYTPGVAYPYYGSFSSYYTYGWGSSYYSPSYYSTTNKYFVEGNLYDAKTDELLVSIQSRADNPEAISKSSKQYAAKLIAEMEEAKIIKK